MLGKLDTTCWNSVLVAIGRPSVSSNFELAIVAVVAMFEIGSGVVCAAVTDSWTRCLS